MIKSIDNSKLISDREKTFAIVCDCCGKSLDRKLKIEHDSDIISNTHASLCDECQIEFIEWMRKNRKLKTERWCKNIATFIEERI